MVLPVPTLGALQDSSRSPLAHLLSILGQQSPLKPHMRITRHRNIESLQQVLRIREGAHAHAHGHARQPALTKSGRQGKLPKGCSGEASSSGHYEGHANLGGGSAPAPQQTSTHRSTSRHLPRGRYNSAGARRLSSPGWKRCALAVHSHRPPLTPHFPPLSPTFWRGSGSR